MKNLLIATAVAISSAMTLGACANKHGETSVGRYVDDATITGRVKARFAEDPRVSAMRINVETLKGEVQLSGFAATAQEKSLAAELASNVPGVTKVRNDIVIQSSDNTGGAGGMGNTGGTGGMGNTGGTDGAR